MQTFNRVMVRVREYFRIRIECFPYLKRIQYDKCAFEQLQIFKVTSYIYYALFLQ